MTQQEEATIAKVLDREKLKALSGSKVVDVKWLPYVDSLGEDALRVNFILNESLTDADLVYATVEPVERAVREGLKAAGIELWPYFWYAKQSELDELGVTL